jgi:hypothetical protein
MPRNEIPDWEKQRTHGLLVLALDRLCREPYFRVRRDEEGRKKLLTTIERHYSRRVAEIRTLEDAENLLREAIERSYKNHPQGFESGPL